MSGAVALLVVAGCAEVPADRYGVARLRLEGAHSVDPASLRACLATAERERFAINLGRTTEPECNAPPFDSTFRLRLPMWKWPWTEWPIYDRNVFERDLQRVERWYRARGFYEAQVVSSGFDPPQAAIRDRIEADEETGEIPCERIDDDEGCRLELSIRIEEGEPVLVQAITMDGAAQLPASMDADDVQSVGSSLRDAWQLKEGEPFDEAYYERSKEGMLRALHQASFGCATVKGDVQIDPEGHRAAVRYTVVPGPLTRIGDVTLSGEKDLRSSTILAVADIDRGELYTDSLLESARHEIYALGAFASVEVVGAPRRDEAGQCTIDPATGTATVDVSIAVTPGRRLRYGFGFGLQSGNVGYGFQTEPQPQWDIHLLGFIEHRNFLGGLRRARLEARPKLIFADTFPQVTRDGVGPRPGIELRAEMRQPAFLEARTTLVVTSRYDLGLDPFLALYRHDLDAAVGLRRNFYDGKLSIAGGIHFNLYRVSDDARAPPSNYELLFLEQNIVLDLRDDTRNPTLGVYLGLEVHEAALLTWDYVRIVPGIRGYVPLGPLVLAARFRLGWMRIFREQEGLDPISEVLGPQRYRLRAGGASSHRGFVAGFLGDDPERAGDGTGYGFTRNSGGLRRWEASVELRVPVNADFGLALFADMGDVNRKPQFRFQYIHLALGFGFRYQTIIGPFRFDMGFLVPGAQVIGSEEPVVANRINFFGLKKIPGAVHLTIGEAF